jgi:hypothetical protein
MSYFIYILRLGLIEDSFALSLSGSSPLSQSLQLVMNFIDEDDFFVWNSIVDSVLTVFKLFEDIEEVQPLMKNVLI